MVLGRQLVQHGRDSRDCLRRAAGGDLDGGGTRDAFAELGGDEHADIHGDHTTSGAARTDTTGGRWSARSRHESPSSVDAYTSPVRVPK